MCDRGGVMIETKTIEDYQRDGVVCVRSAVSAAWIERLRAGLEHNVANPSERARLWDRTAEGHETFYDSQTWQHNDTYREFIFDSPMAEQAAGLMQSSATNFFFDAMFVRSPGAQFSTPFHQDEPYWSVEGYDTVSAWVPLDPVGANSSLELVRGSHLWNKDFQQTNFGALTGDERDQVTYASDDDRPQFPDIEADRASYDLVSWDMEPGDVVFFNGRTVHGGGGRLPEGEGLRVFNTKWLGDDVRVCFRPDGMDPDHSGVMTEAGLAPGDRIGGAMYPEVWRTPTG